jgi:hypothetical protein
MIKLRPGLLVSAHMVVGIELQPATADEQAAIWVHTPDGAYWELVEKDMGAPANEATLISLATEIDRQCKEIGVAAFMDDKVKRAIEQRIELETQEARKPIKGNTFNRQL